MVKPKEIRQKLLENLKELHLSHIRLNYEEVAQQAEKESLSYEEFLYELISGQCIDRRNKRIQRYIRESNIPKEKNLESFEINRLPKKVIQQVKTLLKGAFTNHKENILSFGNPGSGKTHLLCAIGLEIIEQYETRVYFTTCCELVQELLLAKKELRLSKYLKKLSKFNAIILDDIGYVQQNRNEMEVLFTFLAERYERGTVMLTSNLPFSKWEQIFKDPLVTAAAIDRLVHHSMIIELNIPSYRMEDAKKRQKGQEVT